MKLSTSIDVTPARLLSNLFWNQIDYKLLEKTLNNKLHVLEVGCGSGKYRDEIRKNYSELIYTGVDIKYNSQWEEKQDLNTKFYINSYLDIKNVIQNIKKPNIIFTQSALEHFEEDLTFFNLVNQIASSSPLVFINLFPSRACLKTHLNHGIRQYNSRTIKIIIKNLNSEFNAIIPLGSREFNRIHLKYITIPNIFLKKDKSKLEKSNYSDDLNIVLQENKYDLVKPTFYCLISIFNLEIKNKDIEEIFQIQRFTSAGNDSFFH
jgi:hypothetical protein